MCMPWHARSTNYLSLCCGREWGFEKTHDPTGAASRPAFGQCGMYCRGEGVAFVKLIALSAGNTFANDG
jgi:hypothetical protein